MLEPGLSGQTLTELLSTLGTAAANGDLVDALGLPTAAYTGMDPLFAGFALAVIEHAASEISADFSGLF